MKLIVVDAETHELCPRQVERWPGSCVPGAHRAGRGPRGARGAAASTALKAEAAASLKGMSGGVQAGDPMPGEGPWDPIGFSKLHENIQGSEHAGVVPSQQWMREAEIKHGRVTS